MNRMNTIFTNMKNRVNSLIVNNTVNREDFEKQILGKIENAIGDRKYLTTNEKETLNNVTDQIIADCRGKSRNFNDVKRNSMMNNHRNNNSIIISAVLKTIDEAIK